MGVLVVTVDLIICISSHPALQHVTEVNFGTTDLSEISISLVPICYG